MGASVQDNEPDASPIKEMGGPQVAIKSLHSVVQDTVLLQYTNGVLVRLALPKIYTSCLIGRCLSALKCSLKNRYLNDSC